MKYIDESLPGKRRGERRRGEKKKKRVKKRMTSPIPLNPGRTTREKKGRKEEKGSLFFDSLFCGLGGKETGREKKSPGCYVFDVATEGGNYQQVPRIQSFFQYAGG